MTKQFTRQEVEDVVERLVDKTLSEGCIIESDGIKYHVARAAKKIIYCYLTWTDRETNIIKFDRVNDKYQIIGHQVIIGIVLEKMQGATNSFAKVNYEHEVERLCQYWMECGFSRSLQEIVEASGWEYTLTAREADSSIRRKEVLTSPEANALFSFLIEIG